MTKEACIFDFDGVLVDSERVLVKMWGRAAAEYGYTLRKEHFIPSLGRTLEEIERLQMRQFGPKYPFKKVLEKVQQFFHTYIQTEGLPQVDGALDVRNYFADREYKLAVASSTYSQELSFRMQKAGLDGLFEVVLGGDQILNSKPAPDIFLKAAQDLGVNPAQCVVLEDSENGVLSAKRAGMCVFAVQNLGPVTDIMRENADKVFSSHHALLQFLREDWDGLDERC